MAASPSTIRGPVMPNEQEDAGEPLSEAAERSAGSPTAGAHVPGSGTTASHPAGSAGRTGDAGMMTAVFAACVLFMLIAAIPRQWTLGLIINDEYWHAQLARNLFEGNGYVSNVMYPLQATSVDGIPVPEPMKQAGFQLLTALAWLLTGESVRAMLMVAIIGMATFAAAVYALARHLGWSRGVSLFAVGATALHPIMAQYGVQALPESLYFACFTLTLLAILRGSARDVVAAGVLNAALMLVKGHGLIYVPLFAAFLWVRGSRTIGAALRPTATKLRLAGIYVGMVFATLIVGSWMLPNGSIQLFNASGTYSHGLLIEVGRATSDVPYLSVDPPSAWSYIAEHPDEYLGKVARMVRRTKIMVDALSGPAMSGMLFPALLLSCLLLVANTLRPGRFLPGGDGSGRNGSTGEAAPYLFFAAIIGWSLLVFWPIYLSARFIAHTLPLMLLICLYVGSRLGALVEAPPGGLRKAAAGAAVLYLVVYPAATTAWESYRTPMKRIGSLLAVRYVDYTRVADNVDAFVPPDAVIVSDMAHEIAWLTGSRGIIFPNSEDDLEYLISKFDVKALYEHPEFTRDWPLIREQFELVDDGNGSLWVRRPEGTGPGQDHDP